MISEAAWRRDHVPTPTLKVRVIGPLTTGTSVNPTVDTTTYLSPDMPHHERQRVVDAWLRLEFEGGHPQWIGTLHTSEAWSIDRWRGWFWQAVDRLRREHGLLRVLAFPSVNYGVSTQIHLHLLISIPATKTQEVAAALKKTMGDGSYGTPFVAPHNPSGGIALYSLNQTLLEGPWWGRSHSPAPRRPRKEVKRARPRTVEERAQETRRNRAARQGREVEAITRELADCHHGRDRDKAVTQPMVPVQATLAGCGRLAIRLGDVPVGVKGRVSAHDLPSLLERAWPNGEVVLLGPGCLGLSHALATRWLTEGDRGVRRGNSAHLIRCEAGPSPMRIYFPETRARQRLSRDELVGTELLIDEFRVELDLLVAANEESVACDLARWLLNAKALAKSGISAMLCGDRDGRGSFRVDRVIASSPSRMVRRRPQTRTTKRLVRERDRLVTLREW